MYLDMVIIDYLSPEGLLSTYKVTPNEKSSKVVVDRFIDINPEYISKTDMDIGGTRIYNASQCKIDKISCKIRDFELVDLGDNFKIKFEFKHIGIPIGPSNLAHGGLWHLILPPGLRLINFYVSDPYDDSTNENKDRKQFRHNIIWDSKCSTQMIEMDLRSKRGTFSFITGGTAVVFQSKLGLKYIDAEDSDWRMGNITDIDFLSKDAKRLLGEDLSRSINWSDLAELKPNIFGLGINLNQIIKDLNKKILKRR